MDAKLAHAIDQELDPLAKEVARIVTAYYMAYVDAGYPPNLAHDFALAMERRLLGQAEKD